MRWCGLVAALGLLACSEGVFGAGQTARSSEGPSAPWLDPLAFDTKSRAGAEAAAKVVSNPPTAAAPTDAWREGARKRRGVAPAGPTADSPMDGGAGQESPSVQGRRAPGVVVAKRRQVTVYERPDTGSSELGALRAGAVVSRTSTDEVVGVGCPGGFWPIEPSGFVCGKQVSTDPKHILARALARRPERRAPLPYYYGRSKSIVPPLYNRIPNLEQQRRTEPERTSRSHSHAAWKGWVQDAVPDFLAGGQASLKFNGERRSLLAVSAGRPIADSAFAFMYLFEEAGRAYGLSTDLSVLPLDHLDPVRASDFAGVPLGRALSLPLVFVRARHAQLFEGHPLEGLSVRRGVHFREAFGLTGERLRVGGRTFLGVDDGGWLLETPQLTRVEAVEQEPRWASAGSTWIDISLGAQTLVAYEGMRPVYATLISSGRERGGEPETSFATVEGQFRIHTKHVTATMDSDVPGDEFDLRDVPYVQYFDGNFALHAAFWHDAFGAPRSHGCVNLSPLDARWLFDWTEPKVPELWHTAKSLLRGTLVSIHR